MQRAFNPLEDLQHKPIPKKKELVIVKIRADAAAAAPEDESARSSEDEEEDEEDKQKAGPFTTIPPPDATAAATKHKIKFVDKREEVDFKPDLFMEELKKMRGNRVVNARAAAAAAPAAAAPPPQPPKKGLKKTKKVVQIINEPAAAAAAAAAAEPPAEETYNAPPPPPPAAAPADYQIKIGDTILGERIPMQTPVAHKISKYYMENRKMFLNTVRDLLAPYKDVVAEQNNPENAPSCDRGAADGEMSLLTHQMVVRDYLNLFTPYRGLLLYHGLGSGKTCTSIAIAEGMKTQKQIIVMTPKSLRANYLNELKKCGDRLYKRTQFWEFVPLHKEDTVNINALAAALSLPAAYIVRERGAWVINIKKPHENYSTMNSEQQKQIDRQLDAMIDTKYHLLNYRGGLTEDRMRALTRGYTINPFDNTVVVVDEAHNFVSRIVNKLKQKSSISYKLYHYLMSAQNARIVFLTGTPIINYPNEISILYNILRGYIRTWKIPLKSAAARGGDKINRNTILEIFDRAKFKSFDYIDVRGDTLIITRNPFGFLNLTKPGKLPASVAQEDKYFEKYGGVTLDKQNRLSDDEFLERIVQILRSEPRFQFQIPPLANIPVENNKALPDTADQFMGLFVDEGTGNVKNVELLKKRILGLTSYFRSAQESLLPAFHKSSPEYFEEVQCVMSDYQFQIYSEIRHEEREKDKIRKKNNKKKEGKAAGLYKEISSTYRVMSRVACNFVFPEEIERPVPRHGGSEDAAAAAAAAEDDLDEDEVDGLAVEEVAENVDGRYTEEDKVLLAQKFGKDPTYKGRLEAALKKMDAEKNEFLREDRLPQYSPKFAKVLYNMKSELNVGLHLLYTNFRTLEGVGIFKMVLEANGFSQFRIIKNRETGEWELPPAEATEGEEAGAAAPQFALYTGTEDAEEKELILNIYNGLWNNIPYSLAEQIRRKYKTENNMFGQVIKIFMITASGSEGINLKNTRHVHIMEPYWHPVRTEQVIGRARRICSHNDFNDPHLRTVKVFMYLSTFAPHQYEGELNIELKTHDRSRDPEIKRPITTDEYLYELSTMKEKINQHILHAVKETAMDCSLYNNKFAAENGEQLVCYGLGKVTTNAFLSYPTIDEDRAETTDMNVRVEMWKGREITIKGRVYVLRPDPTKLENELYDRDEYDLAVATGQQGLQPIGILRTKPNKKYEVEFFK